MHRKLLIGLLATGFCFQPAIAHSACNHKQVLVKDSSTPSYEVGTCLHKRTYITLGKKEWIVLQYKNEQPRQIEGPYSDWVAIHKQGLLETLIERIIKLLTQRAPSFNCGVWQIDPLQDNAFCFESTDNLTLCRADTSRTDTLIIRDRKTGKRYKSNWLAGYGNNLKAWPLEKLPVYEGAVYLIRMAGKIRKLTFHKIPETLSGNYKTSWMVGQRCTRQAKKRWPAVPGY